MIQLTRDHDLRLESVARVDARISARRLEHTDRPAPRSALDAKLSAQYVLARALVDREVTLSHFEGDSYQDQEIQEAMKLVRLDPLDAQTLASEGDFFADVAVTLRDGGTLTASIERPVGHHAGVPLEAGQLRTKFEACVQRHLARRQIDGFYEMVQSLEQVANIRELTDHMVVV